VGTGTGAAVGQILYVDVDKHDGNGVTRVTRFDSFLRNNFTDLTLLRLMLYNTNGTSKDIVHYDNIFITPTVGTPSQIPVANAGADQSVPGTSVGGVVTLDAGGSHDDGAIVRYRWLDVTAEPNYANYYSRTLGYGKVLTTTLPNGSTMKVRLEVVDNDGLQAYDETVITVGRVDAAGHRQRLGPFGVKHGDLSGKSQHPFVVPTYKVKFEVINQVTGITDPCGDTAVRVRRGRRPVFHHLVRDADVPAPGLTAKWETPDIIGPTGENNQIIIGERFIYVVGSSSDINNARSGRS